MLQQPAHSQPTQTLSHPPHGVQGLLSLTAEIKRGGPEVDYKELGLPLKWSAPGIVTASAASGTPFDRPTYLPFTFANDLDMLRSYQGRSDASE